MKQPTPPAPTIAVAATHAPSTAARSAKRSFAIGQLGLSTPDIIDGAFAIVLTLLGLTGFRFAFGRYEYMIVGAVAAMVGALVALVILRFKLPGLFALALGCVAFLLFGAAVAIRDHTIAGIFPTPSGVTGLIDGTMSGWRRLLTTLPPSGSLGNLFAVPFLCGYVPVLVATLLARYTKWLGSLIALPAAVLGVSVLFGDRKPFSLVVQGALFAAVSIAWMTVRRARERRVFMQSAGYKRLAGALVMLGVIGAAGFAIGPRMPFANSNTRYVLDRATPPFDPHQYGSPLNGYGKFLNGEFKNKVLFTVSGVPKVAGQDFGRVRLATMDDYNGVVWEVDPQSGSQSYQFLRVGESVASTVRGRRVTLDVSVGDLPGVWVPDAGVVTGITWTSAGDRGQREREAFRLSTYTQTAAVAVSGGLAGGDSYVVHGVEPVRPSDDQLRSDHIDASLRSKIDAEVPDSISAKAGEIIKDKTSSYDQAVALSQWFHTNGYYTTGNEAVGESKLLPGHSAARLAAFMLDDTPVGSSEQYAAAMALMARKVGLPARVVMGFRIDESHTTTGAAVAVKGGDVDAWVEIPFTDAAGVSTWVTFDPTPRDKTNKPPVAQIKAPRPKFESQDVPPPPLPPPPPDVVELQSGKNKPPKPKSAPPRGATVTVVDHTVLITASAAGGTPVLIVGGFSVVVLLLKRHRRNGRRRSTTPSNRVAGGWDEYVDTARDIGLPIISRSTRRETALLVQASSVAALAGDADAAVFGPDEPTDAQVASYWDRVGSARAELRSELSIWKRARASLSLTSLKSP